MTTQPHTNADGPGRVVYDRPPADLSCQVLCRRPDGASIGGVVSPDGPPPRWGRPVDKDRWRDVRIGDRVLILVGQYAGEVVRVTEFAG